MENNDEYLKEEKYQKVNNKVKRIGTILLCLGVLMLIGGLTIAILAQIKWHNSKISAICAPCAIFGLAFIAYGAQAKLLGNARNIQAYMTQQGMPIAQEGMEKMAPAAGVAAKEIAKSIKEGLKEDNVIYCKHCEEKIDADSTFCKKCGKQL